MGNKVADGILSIKEVNRARATVKDLLDCHKSLCRVKIVFIFNLASLLQS